MMKVAPLHRLGLPVLAAVLVLVPLAEAAELNPERSTAVRLAEMQQGRAGTTAMFTVTNLTDQPIDAFVICDFFTEGTPRGSDDDFVRRIQPRQQAIGSTKIRKLAEHVNCRVARVYAD